MRLGKYRHYKGGIYKVIDIGENSETGREMVLYKALYGNRECRNKLWVRPINVFNEWGKFRGKKQHRFVKVPSIWERLYCWWKDLHWYVH